MTTSPYTPPVPTYQRSGRKTLGETPVFRPRCRLRTMPGGVTRLLLAIGVIAVAQGAGKSVPGIAIIPRPALVRHLNGSFLLGRSPAIYADPAAKAVAQW